MVLEGIKLQLSSKMNPRQEGGSGERLQRGRSRSPASFTNHHNSVFSRWSRMELLRFTSEDLKSLLFKIDQFFLMENVRNEEKIGVAALQSVGGGHSMALILHEISAILSSSHME